MSEKKSSPRPTLILVRHAHTGMAGRFCGQIDPPLSSEGLTQLPELDQRLNGYSLTYIFSSDLLRARQTAGSIASRRSLPVHLLASLREIAFGSWEGLNWEQVMAQDRDYAQRWLDLYPSIAAPGGEEFEQFAERIQNAMHEIAAHAQGGCAVVVTHAGVIRTLTGNLMREGHAGDFKCDYGSCFEVRRDQERWTLLPEIAPGSAAHETPLVISD
jgi:broad specificity phosphatase PhoE